MITSTHILTLSSLRWKGLHFLFSRITNSTAISSISIFITVLFASSETTWYCSYPISSAVKCVKRWRVSWKRSIAAIVPETSFLGVTSGGVAKCRFFSQAIRITAQKLQKTQLESQNDNREERKPVTPARKRENEVRWFLFLVHKFRLVTNSVFCQLEHLNRRMFRLLKFAPRRLLAQQESSHYTKI